MLSGRENDDLDRLAAFVRAQDPVFAHHLRAAHPVAPREYRRARSIVGGLAVLAAGFLVVATVLCEWPALSAVLLLASLGSGMSITFVWPPAGLDSAAPGLRQRAP